MPESAFTPDLAPVALCASATLAERGRAHVFDVRQWRQPVRAFVLRFDGRVVAYLNRCAHVPVEMDWQPGQFLCDEQRWILCSIHGAAYEPSDGRCVGGPCRGGRLRALAVHEQDGQVWWTPDAEVQPAPASAAGPADAPVSASPPGSARPPA